MKQHFNITYKNQVIRVEGEDTDIFNLKYPDFKYLMLDRTGEGWVVEDRSGDFWTNEDINAIGLLLDEHRPVSTIEGGLARQSAE